MPFIFQYKQLNSQFFVVMSQKTLQTLCSNQLYNPQLFWPMCSHTSYKESFSRDSLAEKSLFCFVKSTVWGSHTILKLQVALECNVTKT